jgi:hypothetical protein
MFIGGVKPIYVNLSFAFIAGVKQSRKTATGGTARYINVTSVAGNFRDIAILTTCNSFNFISSKLIYRNLSP